MYTWDHTNLALLDADGQGRTEIHLPGHLYNLKASVSPDGKWVAYFTGTKESEPYDFSLHLLNLSEKTTRTVTNLIAPGFPDNLEPMTSIIKDTGGWSCDVECKIYQAQNNLSFYIQTLAWSPNSTQLAFTAQIDGPSSDVYIYDIDSQTIRRLTDDLPNISALEWAPNGKKLLYVNSYPGMIYASTSLHIADPNIQSPQSPKAIYEGTFWGSLGWMSDNEYVVHGAGDGGPLYSFASINVDTNQVREFWPYTVDMFLADPDRPKILFLSFPYGTSEKQPEPEAGLYWVDLDGTYQKATDEIYYPVETQPNADFLAIDGADHLFLIHQNGSVTDLGQKIEYQYPPRTSPNGMYTLIPTSKGLVLFSRDQLLRTWDIKLSDITWRPDSTGAFLYEKRERLYYVSIPSGEPVLIDTCRVKYCWLHEYLWLP